MDQETYGLVLVDLMLPKRDGLEVLTALRRRGLQTPVLVLTAKDTVEDRVPGLDLGADSSRRSGSRQNAPSMMSPWRDM